MAFCEYFDMIRLKVRVVRIVFLSLLICNNTYSQATNEKQILWTADWSPDGKFIAVGGNTDTLKIYNRNELKVYKAFYIGNTITRIKWHPVKNLLAVTTQMSVTHSSIIDLETNEKIDLLGVSVDGARGVDWNRTGEYLAVADNDGQILIFNLKGDLIRKFNSENSKSITAIEWHPKLDILACVGDKIRFYDMQGTLLKVINHRPEDVLILSIAWHRSGKFFVIGDYGDDTVKSLLQFWTMQGELIKSIDISKGEYRNLAWNSKGNRLATASDKLRIWDIHGKLISEGQSTDNLWGVTWNKRGSRVLTSSLEQNIVIWDERAKLVTKIE